MPVLTGTGNVSETHMRNRQGTPCGGSLRPNRVWSTLLRFSYHQEFRTLRGAPKGFALGTHKPFVKGLTENFFLPKPDTPMIIGVSLTFVEWARAKKVFCPLFFKKGAGSRGTGNVSETHMRNRQGTPCGGSLRPNFVWSTLLRFCDHISQNKKTGLIFQ